MRTLGPKTIHLVVFLAVAAGARPAHALINLLYAPSTQTVDVCDTFQITLIALSDDATEQSIGGMDVLLFWDPEFVELTGLINNGPYDWLTSSFPNDSAFDGLNADFSPDLFWDDIECTDNDDCAPGFPCNDIPDGDMCQYTGLPFNDGNAYYQALARFAPTPPAFATPEGLLVVTFEFRAIAATDGTLITMPATYGQYSQTWVLDGYTPGEIVTGELSDPITVVVQPQDTCGDGTCDCNENCESCAADCVCDPELYVCLAGVCETFCGNGICDGDENCDTCVADCACDSELYECLAGVCETFCGNDICDGDENCGTCADCGCPAGEQCTGSVCETYCGNDICDGEEDCDTCTDCACDPVLEQCTGGVCETYCGNGFCDDDEDTLNCPEDCAECEGDLECDDSVDCTADVCVDLMCVNTPIDGDCDNFVFCDGAEVCHPITGCQPGGDPCNDGVGCTIDSCDEVQDLCEHLPDHASCADTLFCNGAETCDPVSDCLPGTDPCEPGFVCNEADDECVPNPVGACCAFDSCFDNYTLSQCNALTGEHHPGETCDSGICDVCGDTACAGAENCESCETDCPCGADEQCEVGGVCETYCGNGICEADEDCKTCVEDCACEECEDSSDCDDLVFCTVDICDPTDFVCLHLPNNALCADEFFCNGDETCDTVNGCLVGVPPCPPESCDEGLDECPLGACCVFGGPNCEDDVAQDDCEGKLQGTYHPGETCYPELCAPPCDDGSCDSGENCATCPADCPCAGNETCIGGVCQTTCGNGACDGGETCISCPQDCTCDCVDDSDCLDAFSCTTDICVGGNCFHNPNDFACQDTLFCNGTETCHPTQGCQPGADPCPGAECDEQSDQCIGTGLGACCAASDQCLDNLTEVQCLGLPDGRFFVGVLCSSGPCEPTCGDAMCQGEENCETCEWDCACDDTEQCIAGMCHTYCGNGVCDPNETTDTCPQDCDVCQDDSDCNDGIGCTIDICNAVHLCAHVIDHAFCNDGGFCNGLEQCDPDVGCVPGPAETCNDGIGCTIDFCDVVNDSCVNVPDGAGCDNGLFCDGVELCDADAGCIPGSPACPDMGCDEVDDECYEYIIGACCILDGEDCIDSILMDVCTDAFDGEFHESAECSVGLCQTIIVGSNPPNGAIDARQPTDPWGDSPAGWQVCTIEFSRDTPLPTVDDFLVSESGGDGVPPAIEGITLIGFRTIMVNLFEPIEPGAWTTITHIESNTSVRLGYLPADVGGDGLSGANDVLFLINHLNGIKTLPVWSTDVDRSNEVAPFDVLRVIDLLNGAGVYEEWFGQTLPE